MKLFNKIIVISMLLSPWATLGKGTSSHKWPHEDWREAVETIVLQRLKDFEAARDREEFCPGYSQASQAAKINCWSILVRATVGLESSDNPRNTYFEPMGYNSVGVLQLSKNECKNAPTEAKLREAVPNLICGTNKMANFIKAGQRVEGKSGAGKYWSVLRKPYRYGSMKLGKINEIQAVTKKYQDFSPGKVAQGMAAPAQGGNPALSGTPPEPAPAPAAVARTLEPEPVRPSPDVVEPAPAPVAEQSPPVAEAAPAPEADSTPEAPQPAPRKKQKKQQRSAQRSPARAQRYRVVQEKSSWAENFWKEQERNGH